jgi:serine protease Do
MNIAQRAKDSFLTPFVIASFAILTYFTFQQRSMLRELMAEQRQGQNFLGANVEGAYYGAGDAALLRSLGENPANKAAMSEGDTRLAAPPAVIEKIVTKTEMWRPIQEKVRDTVVQVFSQIVRFDLLQPYKTPAQSSACGSAFFINADGDLITNAHVINQAQAVWIQIPSLGKRIVDVNVVGLSVERDIALLRLSPQDREYLKTKLGGAIPFLSFGDSDKVRRADEVMALGYPLGQQSLKSTTGVISGREHTYFQFSAAINPGNSGGPLLNTHGDVIGINSAGILEAQNVAYMIPINDVNIILPDLYTTKLVRKPFLGILFNNATETLTEFLGNPHPGGCYIVEIVKNSTLWKAGVKTGDMLYEINGHKVDEFGEMSVPWGEDKISIMDYVGRLSVGDDVHLVIYRKGKRMRISVKFDQTQLPGIHRIYLATKI